MRPAHQRLHQHRPGSSAAFRWSVLLNSLLSGLQLAIGFAFGSLALVGDALHNLGDVAGLILGWGAERLSTRPTTERFTYGYGRSTELAALFNALLIFAAGVVVMVEALQRLLHPQPVVAGPVAWAAAAGVMVNLLSARAFGSAQQQDLNRRAAVLHLLTDAAVSAAVLVSALLVLATGWSWLDSLTALGVGLAVSWTGWTLLRESVRLSLDAVPRHIDLEAVTRTLSALPGVVDVHHLHVWAISTTQTALTVHLRRRPELTDMVLLHRAKRELEGLGIVHATIQLEPEEQAGDQPPSCP
jgi:cobalt-zinc-cadmium efflux system protein